MTRITRLSWLALALAVAVVSPASADTYYVYSQAGLPPSSDLWVWCFEGTCDIGSLDLCDTPEGATFLYAGSNTYIGWGVFLLPYIVNSVDLTAYESGEVRFWVRAPADESNNPIGNVKLEIECASVPTAPRVSLNLIDRGWNPVEADSWQEITIPVCDFFEGGVCDTDCLGAITSPFMATLESLPYYAYFDVDYVRWVTENSHTGATSVQVSGRQLLVNGEPFAVNGMNYAPVPQCEGWQYAWYDRYDLYSVDFPLIAASGANTVRLYAPIVSTQMLDEAWANGLYVIPTFGVDEIQLTCSAGRNFMRERFLEMVEEWGDHPAILAWLVGNEVNGGLTPTELCDTWYPQLDSMAAAAHAAEGTSAHPVGTANSVVSQSLPEICQSGCSDDTTLQNIDFWAVQPYLGCTFRDLFTTYEAKEDCDRPLIVTEFGVDAYDYETDTDGFEDETMQADCIESLLDHAGQALAINNPGGVSSGQVIFAWADEWWKGECTGSEWCNHDTCEAYVNSLYDPDADTSVNEEWWGMVKLSAPGADAPSPRAALDRVGDAWLGSVCNMVVDSHVQATGGVTISFDPAAGHATDHTLYYGPLSAVSSYGYAGSIGGLDITGTSSLTLPAGSLFWVVVAENGNLQEGCYGKDSSGAERPCFPDPGNPSICDVDPTSGWNCWCGTQ